MTAPVPRPRRTLLVLGAAGQVGTEVRSALAPLGEVIAAPRAAADLAIPGAVAALVERVRPALIVNAAAYTMVDRAEQESEICERVNAGAVRELAQAAAQVGAPLVHYSTDYVFDGCNAAPYVESDATNPLNVYGATKLAGERAIGDVGGPHVIIRTSWIYGPRGTNFMRAMLRLSRERDELRVVDDQIGAPTSSRALAEATRQIAERLLEATDASLFGAYHVSASGRTTWYDFARAILARDPRREEQRCRCVTPVGTLEYPTPAPRPRYSLLDNAKVRRTFGVVMRQWEEELAAVMAGL